MEELTRTEERIMQVLWKLEKAFVKDLISQMPEEPKPPYNTISSVVRILERKRFVGFKAYSKTHEYFPLISHTEYRAASFKRLLSQYFNDSPSALVSFMVEEGQLDQQQVQQLLLKLLQANQASKQEDAT